jgi:hypothetical protein
LVGKNRHSGAPENNWTTHNPFRISKDASCEPYIRVNSLNGFRWQFRHRYYWTVTYRQHERGILI